MHIFNRSILVALLLLCSMPFIFAEDDAMILRCVAFYNLENVFDTIHDEGKNDYEYLPDGGMKWTSFKYEQKIQNMAYAIAQLGTDEDPRGAACVGVSEVENIGRKLRNLILTHDILLAVCLRIQLFKHPHDGLSAFKIIISLELNEQIGLPLNLFYRIAVLTLPVRITAIGQ